MKKLEKPGFFFYLFTLKLERKESFKIYLNVISVEK